MVQNLTDEELAKEVARRKVIQEATQEELLLELIRRNPYDIYQGRKKYEIYVPHSEVVIGIGKDNTASIMICEDDLAVLKELVKR